MEEVRGCCAERPAVQCGMIVGPLLFQVAGSTPSPSLPRETNWLGLGMTRASPLSTRPTNSEFVGVPICTLSTAVESPHHYSG